MKKKINHCLLLFLIIFTALFLMGFRKMKSSDYNKVRGVIVENCNKVGLYGKVTITKLYWTALEIPTYHVTYTYSEKTYDNQKVVLEQNTAIYEDRSSDSYGNVPEYKESFLKQKSVQKVEKKIEKQLKKQKLDLPIRSFSFLSNFSHDEKEKNLDTLASDNLKEGKKDFAGYYQIPYQTLIDKELIEMVIYIDEKTTVKSQDMKEAAKKLDASNLPNGEYSFFYSNTKDENQDSISYSFKVKDGKVVFYEDENLVLEDENQK
ncbi:hypothetical protein [Streptococcus sp.]|uniref:hypothetical protein n=1 Tax=Streptococcus sp. TaxID=1306 RepID=UPI003A8E487E